MDTIKLIKVPAKDRQGYTYYADFIYKGYNLHFGLTTADDYSFNTRNAYIVFDVDGKHYKTGSKTNGDYSAEEITNELSGIAKKVQFDKQELTEDDITHIIQFFINKHRYLSVKSGDERTHLAKVKLLNDIQQTHP